MDPQGDRNRKLGGDRDHVERYRKRNMKRERERGMILGERGVVGEVDHKKSLGE